MKKILLSLLVLMIAYTSNSQTREVIFQETFDGATLPAGWMKMGLGLYNWSIVETSLAGGSPNELHLNWEPVFDGITRMVSPVIDLTGITSIGIQFNHNLWFFGNEVTLGIATSSDNGATWHEGWSKVYVNHSEVTVVSETIATEDVGSSNFRFCIFVDAYSYDFDHWWFDNISVFNMVNIDAGMSEIVVDNQIIAGDQEVKCVVENVGADVINSVELNYQFDDGEIITELFDTNLSVFETATLTFQEQTIVNEGLHELKVWISKVNGNEDSSTANNLLSENVNITLGEAERIPMLELFSASTCAPCVGVNEEILMLLSSNPGKYSISKYQMNWPGAGDPYYTAEGGARKNYYEVSGVPIAFIDGGELYPYTQEEFNDAADEKSFVEIKGTFNINGTTIEASVDVMSYGTISNATLYVIVNEKTTYGNAGTNGETEFHHVMMKFLTGAQGTAINLLPGEHQHFEFTTNLANTHIEEFDDLEVSAFVQDYNSKYVYNSHFLYEYNDIHPYAPSSLILTEEANNTLKATWTAPEGNNQTGYNLYIDGELILENTDLTTYSTNTALGFHIVEVSANYPEECTSVRLAESIIITGYVLIPENDDSSIVLYPNPANCIVNIKGSNVSKITVFDVSGRMLDTFQNKETFDVSRYMSGVYYVVVESDGRQFVKKLVVNTHK